MRLPKTSRHARVEMLPLMDIVFLILIFLVYAMLAMSVHQGMPVSLPASASATPEPKPALALTIQANGSIWLNKRPVSLQDLGSAIKQNNDARDIQIFADAALSYQELFKVLDALKKAGLKKISLQAKPGN